jgi:ubiquitin-like-conjugating enzyme ATG10
VTTDEILFQENPVTHRPSFFVHPCNTAEAMRNLAASLEITRQNYLQAWLGLVGPTVGFHLPFVEERETGYNPADDREP